MSLAFLQSLKEGLEVGIDQQLPSLLTTVHDIPWLKTAEHDQEASSSDRDLSQPEGSVDFLPGEEVPGVTAIVYQDFFTKASAVAVQLLQVDFADSFTGFLFYIF